jgi:DNA-binding NtrC family response regulator
MAEIKDILLTKEGLAKLEAELEYLKSVRREQVAERIKQAIAFGDISENAEYEDAKTEQAFIEGKIISLENTILYAVNVCHGPMIGPEHLPANIREGLPQIVTAGLQPEKQQLPMKDIEKIFIQEALLQSDYNISDAALRLKMSRSTLYRKIKEYQIKTK